jgi:hypothetical protein
VLRAGGTVCLRAATVDHIPTYPYVPYFAKSRATLEATMQTQVQLNRSSRLQASN